jgi:hypothetical protein
MATSPISNARLIVDCYLRSRHEHEEDANIIA